MADTAVAITQGTGTNIDTRTEATNGNHRQVVVLGDPSTNAGVAPVDVVNGLAVQIIPALPAGTNAIGKLAANVGVNIGDVGTVSTVTTVATLTEGGIAHAATDSGKPHKVGLRALASPKGMTVVTNAQRTDALADVDGMAYVKLNTSFADIISERVTDTTGTSTAFSNFSAVASTKNYVTSYSVYNSGAVAGYLDIRDGTSGSVLWTIPLPAGGGANLSSATPLFHGGANTALAYDVSAALTTVYISMSGFQSKV